MKSQKPKSGGQQATKLDREFAKAAAAVRSAAIARQVRRRRAPLVPFLTGIASAREHAFRKAVVRWGGR